MEVQMTKQEWIQQIMNAPVYQNMETRYQYIRNCFINKFNYWNALITDNQINLCHQLMNTFLNTNQITNEQFINFLNQFELNQLEFAGF